MLDDDFRLNFRYRSNGTLILSLLGLAFAAASAEPKDKTSMADSQLPVVDVSHFLPVHTPGLRPGAFETQARSTGVSHAFFLVGCDATSIEWTRTHRERLIELGAFGLVIEAADVEAYRQLETVARGLVVRPVSGDLIAEHLGLDIYPALVTSEGIFQSVLP